ncbi:MAG: amidohydrolase [Bacillota bacterium]|nr:amidohydrolase [Bacillota bacterium]
MKTLIRDTAIVPMTEKDLVIDKGYIIIEDQFIKEVGQGEYPEGEYDKVIDGRDYVALPGFINTHTHAAMTLLRGYANDLSLMDWLEKKIFPMEAKLGEEEIYWGTKLAILEMIKSGTTCFTDMYFKMDQVAQAVKESGIRAVLSRGMIGVGPENEEAIEDSRALVKKWHHAEDGRIQFMLGPHAPYTCPPDYLKRVSALAAELNVGIHIHLAETVGEYEDMQKQYGKTPIALMEETGVLQNQVLAAHCVHMSDEDIQLLKKYNVGVAHNPESNMKLASGVAPVVTMLEAGIPVALGTDGVSSNNDLDMFQEMRTAALLQKVQTMDPTVLPAYQALEMATVNGAKALRQEQQIGRIKEGMRADIILVGLQEPHMIPTYDLVANLVYSGHASDVQTVFVDGKMLMENRKFFMDEEEIITRVKEIAERLNRGEA